MGWWVGWCWPGWGMRKWWVPLTANCCWLVITVGWTLAMVAYPNSLTQWSSLNKGLAFWRSCSATLDSVTRIKGRKKCSLTVFKISTETNVETVQKSLGCCMKCKCTINTMSCNSVKHKFIQNTVPMKQLGTLVTWLHIKKEHLRESLGRKVEKASQKV